MQCVRMNVSWRSVWSWGLISGLVILAGACRTPFEPEIEGFSDLMVVEGRLTDDSLGSVVRLSRSFGLDRVQNLPVQDADVWIEALDGSSYPMTEEESGVYRSDPAGLVPIVGESYRLMIRTLEGREYASSFEIMKSSPPIAAVEWEIGTKEDDLSGIETQGVYIRVDARDPENNTRFYRWTWEEVWEIRVPFAIRGEWVWEPSPQINPFPPEVSAEVCFRTESSTELHLGTSRQLEEDQIADYPLTFADERRGKFAYGYSIEVQQLALSEEEYDFLETLRRNTETTGSIFDAVPAEVMGNIRSLDDSAEVVIGYFGASAVARKRIFISRGQVQPAIRLPFRPFEFCESESLPLNLEILREKLEQESLNFVDTLRDFFGNPSGFLVASTTCSDCRLSGSPFKPSYWPW